MSEPSEKVHGLPPRMDGGDAGARAEQARADGADLTSETDTLAALERRLKQEQIVTTRIDGELKTLQKQGSSDESRLKWWQIRLSATQVGASIVTTIILGLLFQTVQAPAALLQKQKEQLQLETELLKHASQPDGKLHLTVTEQVPERHDGISRQLVLATLSVKNAGMYPVNIESITFDLWLGAPRFHLWQLSPVDSRTQAGAAGNPHACAGASSTDVSCWIVGAPDNKSSDMDWMRVSQPPVSDSIHNGTGPLAAQEQGDSSMSWYVEFPRAKYAYIAATAQVRWCEYQPVNGKMEIRFCSAEREKYTREAAGNQHYDWYFMNIDTLFPVSSPSPPASGEGAGPAPATGKK